MTIDKFDYTWAESGSLGTTPTDEKIQEGWVSGERPKHERFNLLQDRVEKKLNKLQREGLDSFYRDATDPQAMITTGLWDDSWALGPDSPNVITGGSSQDYVDFCVYFDVNKNPRLILADNNANKFEVWDPRTLTKLDTSDVWDDDLPNVSTTEVWECQSMCTDGTHIYAAFKDSNASPNTFQIQSWLISSWDPNASWAATGTTLPGTGTPPTGRACKIILASATKLATANKWITITSSASTAISIITKADGTIDASGAGNDTGIGGLSLEAQDLASDGTNIFFSGDGSSGGVIATATIANPLVGSGGSNFPVSETQTDPFLAACGSNMIFATFSNIAATGDTAFVTVDSSNGDREKILNGQNSYTTPIADDKYLLYQTYATCFDGLNLWVLGYNQHGGTSQPVLLKIDAARFPQVTTTQRQSLNDIANGVFYIHTAAAPTWSDNVQKILFDGRDIWCLLDKTDKLYRLPLALFRN